MTMQKDKKNITAKEYLSQAYRLDQRINSKLEQIRTLNELAAKCTSVISDMPKDPSPSQSKMADTVDKIVDLEREINHDIDKLVDLKRDIVTVIKSVNNTEYQTLLEHRYLCYSTWEQIAQDMYYTCKWVRILHGRALNEVDKFLKSTT